MKERSIAISHGRYSVICLRALYIATLMVVFLAGPVVAGAQTSPHILFTDIITGAKSGGENGNGVYITIYGKNFGASQGSSTVTVGGAPVVQYKIWGSHNGVNPALDKVVVQIGPGNSTGNIIMTVNGQQSNPIPFTVCSGHIYFVSPSGSDSNNGSFATPWASTPHARQTMAAGDTVYLRAGTYSVVDNDGAAIFCNNSCTGTATAYQNFLGYPGETALITGVSHAVFLWGPGTSSFTTFGELTVRSTDFGITCEDGPGGPCNNWRVVGNDVRALKAQAIGIDFETSVNNLVIYGNESSLNCQGDPNCSFDARAYSVYIGGYGTQTNVDIGWNSLHDNPFGKGIQVYGHSSVDTIQGLRIHDNSIYNNAMVGINLGGCDGGCVEFVRDAQVYNNLFWNNESTASTGHKQFGDLEIYSTEAAIGTVQVYNNTFYKTAPSGNGFQAGAPITFANTGPHAVTLANNIFYAADGAPCYAYFDDSTAPFAKNVNFSNNLYFNAGPGPTGCRYGTGAIAVNADAHGVNADPKLLNPSINDFHLTTGSPAIDAGVTTAVTIDYDGNSRPQGPAYDIGAYEFLSGSAPIRPAPPTNLSGVVH